MSKQNFIDKLKQRWDVTSNWQLLVICVVFALTGSLSLKVGRPVLDYLQITESNLGVWVYWPVRLLVILPIYQVLLIIIGSLLGQFRFFWNFEKKMFGRFIPSGKKS